MDVTNLSMDERIAIATTAAPHWVGVMRVARDLGLEVRFVCQGTSNSSFWPYHDYVRGCPTLLCISDDSNVSLGPRGFHHTSVRRMFRACSHITLLAGEAYDFAYTGAALAAVMQPSGPHIILECKETTQDDWVKVAKRQGVKNGMISAITVKGYPLKDPDYVTLGSLPPLPQPALH